MKDKKQKSKKVEIVVEWLSSEEGKKSIEEARERSKKFKKKLEEAYKINPESLTKPFTI